MELNCGDEPVFLYVLVQNQQAIIVSDRLIIQKIRRKQKMKPKSGRHECHPQQPQCGLVIQCQLLSAVIRSMFHFFSFSALQGKAKGRRSALWTRSIVQKQLFDLGCFLHHHAGKVLFISVLILATCCVGLKSACVQSRVDQLWIEGEFILEFLFLPYLVLFRCK